MKPGSWMINGKGAVARGLGAISPDLGRFTIPSTAELAGLTGGFPVFSGFHTPASIFEKQA